MTALSFFGNKLIFYVLYNTGFIQFPEEAWLYGSGMFIKSDIL